MRPRVRAYLVWCITTPLIHAASFPPLSSIQIQEIGTKIWQNECKGSYELLVFWNKQEPFPSLGIGHFIWFPKECTAPFTQTFPDLLAYLKKHTVKLPAWLTHATYCPWNSREEFYAAAAAPQVNELRQLLASTINLQAQFMVERLSALLPTLLAATPPEFHAHIRTNFMSLSATDRGCFALIDYLNFKGDGTNPKERYAGHGWGLLQVLEAMQSHSSDPVAAFVGSARSQLTQRVAHAPHRAMEERWLPGWLHRITSY
jgi:hypothetical protein